MRRMLAALMLFTLPLATPAAAFPDRQVRVIVPNNAGGGTDLIARFAAEKMTTKWGKAVVVENKPGGNANIGAQFVARAKPDGYTVLVGSGAYTINPFLYKEIGFDPADLRPVTLLASAPFALVVHKDSKANSVQDLIGLIKAKGGSFNWASTSKGSPDHLAGELFQIMTGSKMNHIPYKGGSEAALDVVGGRVELGFLTIPTAQAYITGGQVRALAVSSQQRSPLMGQTPTVGEAVTGYDLTTWYGVWVPKDTPQPIVDTINAAYRDALAAEDMKTKLAGMGFTPGGNSPAEFAAFVEAESVKFKKVIDSVGIEKQ